MNIKKKFLFGFNLIQIVLIVHIVLAIFVILIPHFGAFNRHEPPELYLDVKGIVEHYKYPFEKHNVETEDGYILQLHRIPYGNDSSQTLHPRPAVLMLSGLLCSSADWIYKGTEDSLGFLLADTGYDVWLGNNRGTTWSRNHTTLDPDVDRKQFWDFSFHEMGYYDLPAMIDYITNVTGNKQIFYVGHSQGITSLFAMLSERPQYNSKLKFVAALAPNFMVKNSDAPILTVMFTLQNFLQFIADTFHQYEFVPYSRFVRALAQTFCTDNSPFQFICAQVFYFIVGYTPEQMNKTLIPIIVSNTPAGSSFKQVVHFLQLKVGKYRKYDYGSDKNLVLYGQDVPPDYDLSQVKVPIAIYQGDTDGLSSHKDLEDIVVNIPNVIRKKIIPGFNHLDVVWGINATKVVFDDVISTMRKYQ